MTFDDVMTADAEYVLVANQADRDLEAEEYYLACWEDEMDAREAALMREELGL